MAAQLEVLLVNHIELSVDLLEVGDALRVHTLDDVVDTVGNLSFDLLHNLIIADSDDARQRSHQSYLVDFVLVEKFVFNLHDSLAAKLLAVQIVAYEHLVVVFVQAKNTDNLIDDISGDMVNNSAILDGRYD